MHFPIFFVRFFLHLKYYTFYDWGLYEKKLVKTMQSVSFNKMFFAVVKMKILSKKKFKNTQDISKKAQEKLSHLKQLLESIIVSFKLHTCRESTYQYFKIKKISSRKSLKIYLVDEHFCPRTFCSICFQFALQLIIVACKSLMSIYIFEYFHTSYS